MAARQELASVHDRGEKWTCASSEEWGEYARTTLVGFSWHISKEIVVRAATEQRWSEDGQSKVEEASASFFYNGRKIPLCPVQLFAVSLDTISSWNYVYVIHWHRSCIIVMTHSFILIMLYFQARVQVFKRNGGNDNKTEGGRDTAGSRGSRMVGIYIRKSYYNMYST